MRKHEKQKRHRQMNSQQERKSKGKNDEGENYIVLTQDTDSAATFISSKLFLYPARFPKQTNASVILCKCVIVCYKNKLRHMHVVG